MRQDNAKVRIDLGRCLMPPEQFDAISAGSVVQLDADGRGADVYVNGQLFARGEAVAVDGRLGVRVKDVLLETTRAK